jgi:phosphatidylserine/phosphatidylglycerophosphate/cardiolipin synthase-like enzyme
MARDLDVTFLRDTEHGGAADQPHQVAAMLAGFVGAAQRSLDVAIYDFKLSDALGAPVVAAFKQAAERDVTIRIAYDHDKPKAQTAAAFEARGGDPAPVGTEQWLEREFGGTPIELRPIDSPGERLMHSKYVVRDASDAAPAVWTGSANFTDGAWTRQENNVVRLSSAPIAAAYATDFGEMWEAGTITSSGAGDTGATTIDGVDVQWAFSPADGRQMDAHLAEVVEAAKRRLLVSSMVLTSPGLLGALSAAIERGVDVAGVYDGGEMQAVEQEWTKAADGGSTSSASTLAAWQAVSKRLARKPSSEYSPEGPHDFMHNKTLVKDDELVVTGSFNFSVNAEGNAENQLTLIDREVARQYAAYVQALVDEYATKPARRS